MAARERTVDVTAPLYGQAAGEDEGSLAEQITSCLLYKGFCELDVQCGQAKTEEARREAGQLKLRKPPAELLQGLLGSSSSTALQEMPGEFSDEEQQLALTGTDGALQAYDALFTRLSQASAAYAESLGFGAASRTPMLLSRGEDVLPEEVDGANLMETSLTMTSCSTWLNIFTRQRLLLLAFLGPSEGTLRLEMYEGAAPAVTIKTWPGLVIILRSDMLSHVYTSDGASGVLMAWVLDADTTGMRGAHNMAAQAASMNLPVVGALAKWAEGQLEALASKPESHTEMPREWQLAMHHEYSQVLSTAIRGISVRMPGSWEGEDNFRGLLAGMDCADEIPIVRWDHSLYYDPDPQIHLKNQFFDHGAQSLAGIYEVSFNHIKTSCNHAAFVEGVELFDHKCFQISLSEAKGMDPMQRMCIETQYDTLLQAGFEKKDMMGAYIGVMTGVGNIEWCDSGYCSGVTGGSATICSNRTSFVLGVMGPSFAVDTDLASHATALCCAAENVTPFNFSRTQGGLDTLASVATGVHCMIMPQHFVRNSTQMCSVGRTFSFDSRADGYMRGEGCCSLSVRKRVQETTGELLIPDEEAFGTMSGWHMATSGRVGGSTPNAAVQEKVVVSAARQAGIDTLDVDAVECSAIGFKLGDAVEVASIAKSLRPNKDDGEPVVIGSGKTNQGVWLEATSGIGIIKAVYSLMAGVMPPSIHLRQLNEQIDDEPGTVSISQEAIPYRLESAFHGVSSFSRTGSNVHILFWNAANEVKLKGSSVKTGNLQREVFPFWPNGGSELSGDGEDLGYFIVGSWSQWATMEAMTLHDAAVGHSEGGFVWSCAVTLSKQDLEYEDLWAKKHLVGVASGARPERPAKIAARRYVEFQIVRNKDWAQRLYPFGLEMEITEDFIDALGPDDGGFDFWWCLAGEPGDSFRIELRRRWDQGWDRRDVRAVKL